MTIKRRPRSNIDRRVAEQHDPDIGNSFFVDGLPLLRGTEAWDDREDARVENGSCLVSYGTVAASISSQGVSSFRRDSVVLYSSKPKRGGIYKLPTWLQASLAMQ